MNIESSDSNHEDASNLPSRATDVPQELFEDIIHHAVKYIGENDLPTPSNQRQHRDLCASSLVSSYFAAPCRPHTFKRLKLRNVKHIRRLVDLTGTSKTSIRLPHIATLVTCIVVAPVSSHSYWVHQVASVLCSRLMHHCHSAPRISLEIQAPYNNYSLPPSILYFTTRFVADLALRDMHFSHGEDLSDFLAQFLTLDTLLLHAVDVATPPATPVVWRPPFCTALRLVILEECTHVTTKWVLRCMADAPLQGHVLSWDEGDLEAILGLPCNLESPSVRLCIERYRIGEDIGLYLSGDNVNIFLAFRKAVLSAQDKPVRRLHSVRFHFPKSPKDTRCFDASLNLGRASAHLQKVSFWLPEQAGLEGFVLAFHALLEEALDLGKLFYLWGRWIEQLKLVTPDSVFLRHLAELLATQSSWCCSTKYGGSAQVCSGAGYGGVDRLL